jgi:hypothetical protein
MHYIRIGESCPIGALVTHLWVAALILVAAVVVAVTFAVRRG